MTNSQVDKVQGLIIGVVLTTLVVLAGMAVHRLWSFDQTQKEYAATEACWAKGGEYVNGTCEMPEDKMGPFEKVCVAMNGEYTVQKNQHAPGVKFKCYRDGKEVAMPDLTNKDVYLTEDGAVVVERRNR